MVKLKKNNQQLAKKLMLAVILSSTFITILTTAFQLYGLYSRDLAAIDTRLEEIKKVHLDGLANVLWNSDYAELKVRLESLINLPDLVYADVREQSKPIYTVGKHQLEQVIQRNYKLEYFYRGENRNIGEMFVQFDLGNVYGRLWGQLVDILISNSIKTFLIAFFILWIFYHLVTRHIRELSDHAVNITTDNLHEEFKFSHKKNKPDSSDELDVLSNSFNEMKKNISEVLTEIDQSRLKVIESEQFYSSILDMNPAIIYVKNKVGQFIFANRQCENIYKINKLDMHNKTSYDLFSHKIASEQIENDITVMKTRVAIEFEENIYVEKDHRIFLSVKFPLFNEANDVYALGCVSTDITKLKSTTDLLQKKTIEQDEILNNLIDGVITVSEDMKITGINHAGEQILGYREREIVGKDITLLMREEDKPKFLMIKSTLVTTVLDRIIGTSREFFSVRKNGDVFPLQLSINRLPDGDNGLRRFIASFTDLTDIKEKENLLRQSLKLEALGKLTGGIAHDYNNMLGIVSGYAELIEKVTGDNDMLSGYVHQIRNACDRGAKLTKKLLTFSSYRGSDFSVIKLNEVMSDLYDMMQKTLTVRISLSVDVNENIWPVYVDKAELEDSILNMCINAMHAMPDGGHLKIDIENINISVEEARLFELEEGDYVRLSLIDSGCGMSEELQGKIFDPFFTTKGDQGSGLGLSQVYGFVKRSGGSVQVKSTKDVGTRFILYFPRYYSEATEFTALVDKNEDINTQGTEKILVVDDEEALRLLNINLFETQGYEVYAAKNGIDAIPLLEKHEFAIVVSDLLMPEMDGYKLSEYIREHHPETKIQLVSGFHDEQSYNKLDEDLKMSILRKPVSGQVLLKRVRILLDT